MDCNDGSDLFVFAKGSGTDVIVDFSFAAGDRLNLQGQAYQLGSFQDGSATLFLEGGSAIILQGVTQASFSADYLI